MDNRIRLREKRSNLGMIKARFPRVRSIGAEATKRLLLLG
jgi:hypothetical protein